MPQNFRFDLFLDLVGKLHSRAGEELHAIVVVGIVRSGNHHAGRKSLFAHQAGDSGRGDYPRKGVASALFGQPGGDLGGDMGPGFAGVHADQHARLLVAQPEVASEAAAHPVKGLVVERVLSGYAPDAIGSEKFLGHV